MAFSVIPRFNTLQRHYSELKSVNGYLEVICGCRRLAIEMEHPTILS